MKGKNHICHDLKTERPDVGQPLPAWLRLLPFAFYLTAVASVLLTAFFYMKLRTARQSKEHWIAQEEQQSRHLKDLEASYATVKAEAKRAEEAVAWVEGTRSMQDLCMRVARSMDVETTIAELSLARQSNRPAQIQFSIQLNTGRGGGADQIDTTIKQLLAADYRTYSADQNQSKTSLHYSATLIHQEPGS